MPARFIGPYQRDIMEQLRGTADEAAIVEDIMRNHVFHSTLDWQSAAELRRGMREAWTIFQEDREMFESHYREVRRLFEEGKRVERKDNADGGSISAPR